MLTVNEYAQLSARTYDRTLENKIQRIHTFSIPGSKPQTVHSYGTDSVAALAVCKIVLFDLWRSEAFAKVKLIRYITH